ncbi:DUF4059 family protein [Streptococcus suis]|uniref:DUF4059 family protein n=1 Tax=Streptococcus iners TaxID=3028084 RepID=A0AA96VJ19_9STRE|nr:MULTISPECIES: DUF4059 family protein [Streptococcus]MBL1124633.1 DUF4059 family protein [Streptococcus suis]MCK4026480.1 DUF4059 family protein [Streptococcus suis]NQI70889.1 DUF4059 family protein [Streptococcus suis]NQN86470.1 DUF4059 family protein [Streptococcus suis]WNY50707.1 DUF4059 family protein [Streptococcus sp. 29887]
MLQNILSFYLQGLLVAALLAILSSLIYFAVRAGKKVDRTPQERQDFIFDLLMINVMTIPILAFGVMGILLMFKA